MSTEELLSQLRSLPPVELRAVLSQIGYVPEATEIPEENNGGNGAGLQGTASRNESRGRLEDAEVGSVGLREFPQPLSA